MPILLVTEPPMDGFDLENLRALILHLPYAEALHMRVVDGGPGWAELTMPYADNLVGDPSTGVIHGGAVSALLDTTCGAAVIAHPQAGLGTATLDLRIDYMRSAPPGETLRARAECTRVTRSIAFVRAETFAADPELLIASATGAFTVANGTEGTS